MVSGYSCFESSEQNRLTFIGPANF
jgi:hypothetical protein